MLVLGDSEGLVEAGFGFCLVVRRLLQQEFAFEAMEFWFQPAFSSLPHVSEGLIERPESLGDVAHLAESCGQ